MKDNPMADPTPQELVDEMVDLFDQMHAVYVKAAVLANTELDPDCLLRFRALRRQFNRLHLDSAEFIDECVPDATIMSGAS